MSHSHWQRGPKGGIRPHNRFSIKAKRSEVLFADYIAEHLNPKGRAGVIVPEGVIFQSQTTYNKLRRMLVENYLWAVVSLPAGVFNPYSGVKTSILLLDRNLARHTDEVLFVKIANDGFDLGAQRRPIEKNDLPEAIRILIDRKQTQKAQEDGISWLVSRNRLLDSPDCSLSGDRYRAITTRASGKWPTVKIADIASVLSGGTPSKANGEFWSGSIPWVSPKDMKIDQIYDTEDHISEDAVRNSAVNLVPSRSILCVVRSGILAHSFPVALATRKLTFNQDINAIVIKDERVLPEYLFHLLKGMQTEVVQSGVKKGGTVHSLRSRFLHDLAIPLLQIAEQERIVAEMEGYRKIIEGARQVVANYKPTIQIDPSWPIVTLGEVAVFKNGINYSADNRGEGMSVIGVRHFQNNVVAPLQDLDSVNPAGIVTEEDLLKDRDLLFVRSNGNPELVGRCLLVRTNGLKLAHSAFTIRARLQSDKLEAEFYAYLFRTRDFREALLGRGANISNLTQSKLAELRIPVPSLEEQREVLLSLAGEGVLVESNRKLVEIFEGKIKAKLDEIWGTSAEESGVRESPISQSEAAMDLSEPRGVGLADSSSSG